LSVLYPPVRFKESRRIDRDRMRGQPALQKVRFVRHVRPADPLNVRVDDRSGRGVIRHA